MIQWLVESEPFGWKWLVIRNQDFRNHEKTLNHFYLICFFQKQEFKSFEIYITEKIQLNNMVLEILISDDQPFENFKLKLKVSDSTSYWIFLKLHALTYIDPNFHFTKTRIWFDRPRRQTNDFVIFNFWLENKKNHEKLLSYRKLYTVEIVSRSQITWTPEKN